MGEQTGLVTVTQLKTGLQIIGVDCDMDQAARVLLEVDTNSSGDIDRVEWVMALLEYLPGYHLHGQQEKPLNKFGRLVSSMRSLSSSFRVHKGTSSGKEKD